MMWENLILQLCDDYFFYDQIENYNKPFLDALAQYDDARDLSGYDFNQDELGPPHDDGNKRKLAYSHQVIAQKYSQGLRSILDHETIKLWDDLHDKTDAYTDKWFSSARALKECSGENKDAVSSANASTDSANDKRQHVNVLVTSGSLIPSLVKCLLFHLDSLITHGNAPGTWGKFNVSNGCFCVIGDGWEECEAAEILKWPFVKIDPRPVRLTGSLVSH